MIEYGKVYTDYSTYDQTERCLIIFTGKRVDGGSEIILYDKPRHQNSETGEGSWYYEIGYEDEQPVNDWVPSSEYGRQAIRDLFIKKIRK